MRYKLFKRTREDVNNWTITVIRLLRTSKITKKMIIECIEIWNDIYLENHQDNDHKIYRILDY